MKVMKVMKAMKLTLLLSALCLVGLAACGGGPDVGPVEASDAGAETDAATRLCCIATVGNPSNAHCAKGVSASCDLGDPTVSTFDSAACYSLAIGTSCDSWPQSSGSALQCGSTEPCCAGIVQACP